MDAADGMTWHIIATNGRETRVVKHVSGVGGVTFEEVWTEERAEIIAAVLAARNPGWEFNVRATPPHELHTSPTGQVPGDRRMDG